MVDFVKTWISDIVPIDTPIEFDASTSSFGNSIELNATGFNDDVSSANEYLEAGKIISGAIVTMQPIAQYWS